VSHHPDHNNQLSRMAWRNAILGKRFVLGSSSPANGLVLFPRAKHFSISVCSYVCPSAVKTGSLITSIVNGHWKESKTKEATVPAAAGSARDVLCAGAGASSGAANEPRAAVEAEVSAAPDDPSEGDKLNLTINIASASATDMVLGPCLTCVCRSGARELAATLTPVTAAPASSGSVVSSIKWRVDSYWML
jgi:hypothetical protein